tara:strand:+ start:1854 stop:2354 length:501 start_codon:yes stop_codon:yes gene_type:complete
MKVYTEVNYIWKDDKLVQTDSTSFEYDGEIESCHTKKHYGVNSPHSHGTGSKQVNDLAKGATTWAANNNLDKPGGSVKSQITDVVKKWSTDSETMAWGHSSADGNSSGNSAADDDALALLKGSRRGIQGRGSKVKGEDDDNRRGLSNFNTKTLLTQGQKAKRLPKA